MESVTRGGGDEAVIERGSVNRVSQLVGVSFPSFHLQLLGGPLSLPSFATFSSALLTEGGTDVGATGTF